MKLVMDRIVRKLGWLALAALLATAVAAVPAAAAKQGAAACRDNDPACSGKGDDPQAVLQKAFEESKGSGKAANVVVEPEDAGRVQIGDLVKVQYTARLADGAIVRTTRPEVLKSAGTKKAPGMEEPAAAGPEEVLAGKPGGFPGLALAVLESAPKNRHQVKIPGDKAFGPADPKKIRQFPCERRVPLKLQMRPREYTSYYESFPVAGKVIQFNPYLKAKIAAVAETHVDLEIQAQDGEKVEGSIGPTTIRIENSDVRLVLEPLIGAAFEMEEDKGRIVSTDGMSFTVDFNHPLAGKEIDFDIEVVALTKASAFKAPLPWMEDHDLGLKAAGSEKKDMLLVLYAGWCSWSKKLLTESLEDPRIKQMKDKFVWVKVDSDKEQAYKEAYQQNGFPMVVVLNAKGEVVKKIDGYRDAAALKKELEGV
jgi:FKBP-type peptidyl-prolyl cis-trans isomerase 2